ncbi:unnamed protein product [Pocillopora meandrina]|uniref:Uncharacterized protein n=1 Tax=Pocillopora meandrina TaxID=46732 RepID=A0AAU9VSD3_9CNID|nr:unnamed protein product [Pocillopora meandrina]
MLIGTRQQLQKVNLNDITIGDTVVKEKSVVRNLGSWFDHNLEMSSHISKQCASAFYHLHNISRIRNRVTLGDRSFQVAAPVLWNVLPREIRSITDRGIFKCHLKTHLFKEAFY